MTLDRRFDLRDAVVACRKRHCRTMILAKGMSLVSPLAVAARFRVTLLPSYATAATKPPSVCDLRASRQNDQEKAGRLRICHFLARRVPLGRPHHAAVDCGGGTSESRPTHSRIAPTREHFYHRWPKEGVPAKSLLQEMTKYQPVLMAGNNYTERPAGGFLPILKAIREAPMQ